MERDPHRVMDCLARRQPDDPGCASSPSWPTSPSGMRQSRAAAVVTETTTAPPTPTALPSLAAYDVGAIVAGFQLPEGGAVDPGRRRPAN